MATIEVDFDVYKELTMLRPTEAVTYSDVIRGLLRENGHSERSTPSKHPGPEGWSVKGVFFPDGTEFRAPYKGKVYSGIVQGNALVVDGKKYTSPSAAAHAITNTNLNGWGFWQCRLSGQTEWKDIWTLRDN